MRRIFGAKRDEVAGGWRKLHNEELRNLSSLSRIKMIKSRTIRRAGSRLQWRNASVTYTNIECTQKRGTRFAKHKIL
jgi:hypothetical protein